MQKKKFVFTIQKIMLRGRTRNMLGTISVDREKNFMKNDSYLDPLRQQLWALEQNG